MAPVSLPRGRLSLVPALPEPLTFWGSAVPGRTLGTTPDPDSGGETGKLGARGPAQPSPFGVSSLSASYYLCELRLVGEDDRDAVSSGRPGA